MAQSLRELLDAQKAAKKQDEKAPEVEVPTTTNVPESVSSTTAKPLLAGFALLPSVPSQTQKPLVVEAEKQAQAISPSSSAGKAAISAAEFTHENQPILMAQNEEQQLKQDIQFLISSFSDPDMLRQAIVKIMTDLQEKPHLVDLLYPDDIGAIVRSLRESHAVAINVVEEKGSKKRKKAAEVDEFAKLLEGRGGITI